MVDKYDIYFKPVPPQSVRGFKCFEFGYAAPLKVKGFPALINRWVKVFMTPKGSDMLYPDYGTAFGDLFGANITKATSYLRDVVVVAIQEASQQVRDQDIRSMVPVDEQLLSASLTDFRESPDGIEVWVLIKNKAGDSLSTKVATLQ